MVRGSWHARRSVAEGVIDLPANFLDVGQTEILLSGVQRLVPEILLNVSQRNVAVAPTRRARLAEAMKFEVGAYVVVFARLSGAVDAVSTVQTRMEGGALQFAQQMTVRLSLLRWEQPTTFSGLLQLLQVVDNSGRQWHNATDV